MASQQQYDFPLWELPEVLLYHLVGFVASPTLRAGVLCHQIAPLCKASHQTILVDEKSVALWDAVLAGDYGVDNTKTKGKRSCKRLRRSPVHKVRDAHNLLRDNTEIAFFCLSEMAHSSGGEALSRRKLCGFLDEYGPHLRINNLVRTGATYLVEICRARNVKETVILKCVEEMVEVRGANVDLPTFEAQNSTLTALCVAAVRGMPSIVKFLLERGASQKIKCSGRFRLYTNARKSVRCTDATPLEFAKKMKQEELDAGSSAHDLKNLNKCITLLQTADEKGKNRDADDTEDLKVAAIRK